MRIRQRSDRGLIKTNLENCLSCREIEIGAPGLLRQFSSIESGGTDVSPSFCFF